MREVGGLQEGVVGRVNRGGGAGHTSEEDSSEAAHPSWKKSGNLNEKRGKEEEQESGDQFVAVTVEEPTLVELIALA